MNLSSIALLSGIALALIFGNPYAQLTKRWTSRLLQMAVVGLGAGMNLETVLRAGAQGIGYTVIGVLLTLAAGLALGSWLRNGREVSILVSSGTAICGGSAIAAVSAAIGARDEDVSVSLVTVFFLNSVALFAFPPLGHLLALSQTQFGYWAALAIHDTSSVVGASMQYGHEALELATVLKLARALWIVPLAFGIGWFWKHKQAGKKAKHPWFILGFLAMAALTTWVPALAEPARWIQTGAKGLLVLVLFLIGSGVPRSSWKNPGVRRALLQGVALWLLVAGGTLGAVLSGWLGA